MFVNNLSLTVHFAGERLSDAIRSHCNVAFYERNVPGVAGFAFLSLQAPLSLVVESNFLHLELILFSKRSHFSILA